jgi:hypothetical protein
MNDYTLIETNAAVYSAIYATHRTEISVHESFTDVDGTAHNLGNYKPKVDTRWGFKNADYPLIVCIATKEDREQNEWDYKYYLVSAKKPIE